MSEGWHHSYLQHSGLGWLGNSFRIHFVRPAKATGTACRTNHFLTFLLPPHHLFHCWCGCIDLSCPRLPLRPLDFRRLQLKMLQILFLLPSHNVCLTYLAFHSTWMMKIGYTESFAITAAALEENGSN